MSKNKKNKSLSLIALALAAALILGVCFIVVYAYSSAVDYSVDEVLFSAAHSSNITKIYYDASEKSTSLSSYSPVVYESVYGGSTKKEWYPYGEISSSIKNAFVAMEDRTFFEHNGVDLKRTTAAFFNYLFHFKTNFGGSTITQQVIKNISGDSERSVSRKFNEILRAWHIEGSHTKEEIFEVYLNIAPMSNGIVGVGEAAECFFGKSPAELDYIEAATLVGMANAPSKYDPYRHPDACIEKRNKVLYSLCKCGYISEEYYEVAKQAPLEIKGKQEAELINSWFAETVCSDVAKDIAKKMNVTLGTARKLVNGGGLNIYSTVSPKIQRIVSEYFENADNFPSKVAGGLEFSFVVSSPETGALLAIAGGARKKEKNKLLNYAETSVTPGSTLKPIALYAPLLDSKRINWASVFDDVPVSFNENEASEYTPFPKNSPSVYDGLTTVADALHLSKNTVAVRLYNMLGAEKIFSLLKDDYGFDTLIERQTTDSGNIITDMSVSPLALGQLSRGVSLRKLTEAYGAFPNDGVLASSKSYVAVFDMNGALLLENGAEQKRVMKTETARIMNKLLERVVDAGTAKSITLSEYVDTAGKTGTSGDDKDRLFIGYTPYFAAGIWCGYTQSKKTIGTLEISHLKIWDDVAKAIYSEVALRGDGEKNFKTDGLVRLPFCKDSGELYNSACTYDPRGSRLEYGYFSEDNAPKKACERHVMYKYDTLTGAIAHDGCTHDNIADVSLVKVDDRRFPCEIVVTDAEYTCRDVPEGIPFGDSYDVPFFIYAIPEGEYAGRSKSKKQFNSYCYLHSD